jgi:hypothetical protein
MYLSAAAMYLSAAAMYLSAADIEKNACKTLKINALQKSQKRGE